MENAADGVFTGLRLELGLNVLVLVLDVLGAGHSRLQGRVVVGVVKVREVVHSVDDSR